jgi:hypothetical protein
MHSSSSRTSVIISHDFQRHHQQNYKEGGKETVAQNAPHPHALVLPGLLH